MFMRVTFIAICVVALSVGSALAAEMVVELNFPRRTTAKVSALAAVPEAEEVSGDLIIDIAPYPATIHKNRYVVEYFLNKQLLFQTDGIDSDNPQELSFKYALDTRQFTNGQYKLIVNFWDKYDSPGIGIKKIIINNRDE